MPLSVRASFTASNRSPMRRGLKRGPGQGRAIFQMCFKPIPDEEGTETRYQRSSSCSSGQASNRSPMRRGLKHENSFRRLRLDEASNRSPMRRGLKPELEELSEIKALSFKPIPDEEGTETRVRTARSRSAGRLQTDPR